MSAGKQLEVIFRIMRDGEWRTLRAISEKSGYPEASISARLRDIRKSDYYRRWTMESCQQSGSWAYRVILAPIPQVDLPLFSQENGHLIE